MARKKVEPEVAKSNETKIKFTDLLVRLDSIRNDNDYIEKSKKLFNELGIIRKYIPIETRIEIANSLINTFCRENGEFMYNSIQLMIASDVSDIMLCLDVNWDFMSGNVYSVVWDAINAYKLGDIVIQDFYLGFTVHDLCKSIVADIERNELSLSAQLRKLMSSVTDETELSEVINSQEFVKNLADQIVSTVEKKD